MALSSRWRWRRALSLGPGPPGGAGLGRSRGHWPWRGDRQGWGTYHTWLPWPRLPGQLLLLELQMLGEAERERALQKPPWISGEGRAGLTELLPKGAGAPPCAPPPSSSLSALNPSLCSPAPFPP